MPTLFVLIFGCLVGSSGRFFLLFLVLNNNAMLGEQFYLWLRQATDEDLQRARGPFQFEMEMRENQLRMEHERLWREFPLPAFTPASMKDVKDYAATNLIIQIEKFNTKPQDNSTVSCIIPAIDRQRLPAHSKRRCEGCSCLYIVFRSWVLL